MGWTGNRQKLGFALAVLALHALVIWILIGRDRIAVPRAPERETELLLTTLSPPSKPMQKPEKKPARQAAKPSALQRTLSRPLSLPPTPQMPGNALQGLGLMLGCGASNYDTLSPAERAACGHGPWQYDRQGHETAALMIPPPPHQMTAAEIAEHTRNTTDPCMPEKAVHMPFCIYRVIYGDKLP